MLRSRAILNYAPPLSHTLREANSVKIMLSGEGTYVYFKGLPLLLHPLGDPLLGLFDTLSIEITLLALLLPL